MAHRPSSATDAARLDREAEALARSRKDRFARTRRAALMAEFEGDLGIDHVARLRTLADQQRWIRIKTFIVWSVAMIFFAIAFRMVWQLGELRQAGVPIAVPFL